MDSCPRPSTEHQSKKARSRLAPRPRGTRESKLDLRAGRRRWWRRRRRRRRRGRRWWWRRRWWWIRIRVWVWIRIGVGIRVWIGVRIGVWGWVRVRISRWARKWRPGRGNRCCWRKRRAAINSQCQREDRLSLASLVPTGRIELVACQTGYAAVGGLKLDTHNAA